MSKEYSFSVMPSVSISRSRFARKSQHKTSFNLGKIVPIYLDEVLPGDTRSIDMAALVRMSTPIAPIMDNIYIDYFAFFVPNRLTWVHWKEFMGENSVSAGIPSTTYTLPNVILNSSNNAVGSLADYFGIPAISGTARVCALPFRAYGLIYNRWFRNQNLIAPLAIDTSDNNAALIGSAGVDGVAVQSASKLADYFTSALPYAQKSSPVSIPIGTSAPIVLSLNGNPGVVSGFVSTAANSNVRLVTAGSGSVAINDSTVNAGYSLNPYWQTADIVADLSNATAATINQLRYAFQLQKALEKDSLYGSRYWEILNAHFGIKAPDASLQDPEYLGGFRQRVNIDQVLSTAGYDDTSSQEVGKPGANSVTASKSSIFTKSFVEHGYIMILAVARHDQTYAQGINRMWSRTSRFDFYLPVFANLGAQDVLLKEIFAQGSSADNNVFGYQEAWAEYRYKPSISSGLLNPSRSGSLDFWTLTNKFALAPTLGQVFIEQDRTNLARALTTGVTGPDFIADFYFRDIAVRPMPMYSIPGLIDHH